MTVSVWRGAKKFFAPIAVSGGRMPEDFSRQER